MRRHLLFILLSSFLLPFFASAESENQSAGGRFPVIQASLDDGFYVLAEQQARGELLLASSEADRLAATQLMAQALWGQRRYSEMLQLLAPEGNSPGMAYWRARAYFELSNYSDALGALNGAEETLAGSAYASAALRLKGRLFQQSGDLENAAAVYKQFVAEFPDDAAATDNVLDLADVYMAQKRFSEARALYEVLLKEAGEADSQLARLKLAHVLYSTGDAEDVGAARGMLTALADDESVRLAVRIDACIELSALEDRCGEPEASEVALLRGIGLAPDVRLRVSLKLALARKRLAAGNVPSALKLLEECRAEAPDEVVAAELQLEKAGALLQGGQFAEAVDAYQVYLDVSDDPDGGGESLSGECVGAVEFEALCGSGGAV